MDALTRGDESRLADLTVKATRLNMDYWGTRTGHEELERRRAEAQDGIEQYECDHKMAAGQQLRELRRQAEKLCDSRPDLPHDARRLMADILEEEVLLQAERWHELHRPGGLLTVKNLSNIDARLGVTTMRREQFAARAGFADWPDGGLPATRCVNCGQFADDRHVCPLMPELHDDEALRAMGQAAYKLGMMSDPMANEGFARMIGVARPLHGQRQEAMAQYSAGFQHGAELAASHACHDRAPVAISQSPDEVGPQPAAVAAPTPPAAMAVGDPDAGMRTLLAASAAARVYSDVDREERTAAMTDDLRRAVVDVVESGQLGMLLDGMARSRLGSWSFGNKLLATAQLAAVRDALPDGHKYKSAPPMMMTAAAWKREYGAFPAKGSRAIWILRPSTRTITETDPKTGQETKKQIVVGFAAQSEFDISQMSGDKLPKPPTLTPPPSGEAPAGAYRGLKDRVAAAGYSYSETEIAGSDPATGSGVLGYTDPATKQIVVDSRCNPTQRVNVIAHELGHVLNGHVEMGSDYAAHRGQMETEAEATAYMVARALGVSREDSDAFSGQYIASWSKGDPDVVEKALAKASKAFDKIIEGEWPDHD